jgi:hypothetical protein
MLVCLLCADKEELKEASYLFSFGVNLSFIKICDTKTIVRDCFAIAFEGTIRRDQYARASNLRQKIPASFPCSLTAISRTSMWIGTDLELESEIEFTVSIAPDAGPQLCQIDKAFDGPIAYHFTKSYKVNFPFPGAWDEPGPSKILPETIENWLEENKSSLNPKTNQIVVYSKNKDLRRVLLQEPSEKYWLTIYEDIGQRPVLLQRQPDLIFVDLSDDLISEDARVIVESVQESEFIIPVIFFHSSETAEELRASFGYEHILSHPTPLDMEVFQCLVKILLGKIRSELKERFYLGLRQPERFFYIDREIRISSISEHEITFFSADALPLFANIFLNFPIPLYLSIIPGEVKKTEGELKQYRALIHGIDEEGLSDLRIIVNQLILRPDMDLRPVLAESTQGNPPALSLVPNEPSSKEDNKLPPKEERFVLHNHPKQRSKL